MYFSKVIVKGKIELIDIETGTLSRLRLGEYNLTELTHKDRSYHVVSGTLLGSVSTFWEQLERKGKCDLTRMSQFDSEIRLGGIKLPITNPSQLTEHQKTHLVCGHLVKGRFFCEHCTITKNLAFPDAIAVYPINILPYSQGCAECGLLIFNIWQSKKGGPLFIFD